MLLVSAEALTSTVHSWLFELFAPNQRQAVAESAAARSIACRHRVKTDPYQLNQGGQISAGGKGSKFSRC
jgi:hypothetical protein